MEAPLGALRTNLQVCAGDEILRHRNTRSGEGRVGCAKRFLMKKKSTYYPLDECKRVAEEARRRGCDVFQTWKCQHCGEENAMALPNVFYTTGNCENCGNVTEIFECNFIAERGMLQ